MTFSLHSAREQYKSRKESKLVQFEDHQNPTRSLPFQTLIEQLPKNEKLRIVVLASARESVFRFFSEEHACQIWFYPLDRFLQEIPQQREEEGPAEWAARLFPNFPEGPVHAIFAWDLFNYFESTFLCTLAAKLQGICHEHALVFAALSNRTALPDSPLQVDVIDAQHLRYSGWEQNQRKNQLVSLKEFTEIFPGSAVLRSGLLRNGLQEVLLKIHGERAA